MNVFARRGLGSWGGSSVDMVGEGRSFEAGELCWLADAPSVEVVAVGLEKD